MFFYLTSYKQFIYTFFCFNEKEKIVIHFNWTSIGYFFLNYHNDETISTRFILLLAAGSNYWLHTRLIKNIFYILLLLDTFSHLENNNFD